MRRTFLILTVLLVALPLLSATAWGARAPRRGERAAITRAVKHSRLTAAVPAHEYTVRNILVSTVGPYARGETFGIGRYVNMVQPAWVILKRARHGWRLLDIGGDLACRDAPGRVRRDLGLGRCTGPARD